ncbi:MAG: hypothetical protein ABI637_04805 [Gemmatimonadota bacterium]
MRAASLFRATLTVASAALGGCFLDPGACSYDYRDIEFHGQLTGSMLAPGATPVGIVLQLNETRNDDPSFRTLYLVLSRPVPAGAAVIELRQTSGSGTPVIATFSLSAALTSTVDLAELTPTQEDLARYAGAGQLHLVGRAGGGSPPGLDAALSVASRTDWHHLRCD